MYESIEDVSKNCVNRFVVIKAYKIITYLNILKISLYAGIVNNNKHRSLTINSFKSLRIIFFELGTYIKIIKIVIFRLRNFKFRQNELMKCL